MGLLLAAVTAAGGARAEIPGRAAAPDILLISVDTLRADHLGLYGYPRPTDPALARLGAGVTVYHRATSPIPLTVPAHAALLTGRFPRELGVLNNHHRLRVPGAAATTLPARLAAAGYRTAAVVASGVLAAATGLDRGFEVYDEPAAGTVRRSAAEVNARAAALLEAPDGPLFLLVHYYDTHDPYELPDRYACQLRPDAALARVLADRGLAGVAYHEVLNQARREPVVEEGRTVGLTEMVARYDAAVRLVTDRLMDLVDRWDASGRGEGSLVIITSDHGEGLGQHGFWSHGMNLHEEAMRVPLLIRWPAGARPTVPADAPVSLLDLAPTVLHAAGLPLSPDGAGVSLAAGGARSAPLVGQRMRYLYRERPPGVRNWRPGDGFSIIQDGFKYISEWEEPPALYDLQRDPHETRNLADLDRSRAARLRRGLEAWLAAHPDGAGDPQPPDPERLRVLRSLGYADP